MRRLIVPAAVVAAALLLPAPVLARPAHPQAIGAQLVVGGLDWPAAFTFAPDGRIFYGERYTGTIRIYDPATGSDTPFFTITGLETDGERGLLGVALPPNYAARPFVFAYATRNVSGTIENQIIRIRDVGGTGKSARVIFTEDVAANTIHNGGRILFGPDGKLYVVIGEANNPSNSQNLTNDAGKILRMTATGGVPADNPFPGSLIWTYGHRNSYGFTFDPLTRNLWETENGPSCNDELNLITKGANYGWGPNENCDDPNPPSNTNQDGPNPVLPLVWFTPTIAPVGAAFCVGCGLTGAGGSLFFMAYNTSQIWQVVLTADRLGIASESVVYTHSSFVLSMERGPDHLLYFSDGSSIWRLANA
jgi:glucose/arabinose dehydrogenase